MKTFAVLAMAVVGVALAMPTEEIATTIHRTKKSAYGAPPCAQGGQTLPLALYLSPGPQLAPTLAHYREDEHKDEHLNNMETEHARSYYDSPAAAAAIAAASGSGPAISSGPALGPASLPLAFPGSAAVGLFPNAKVGGCAIPLLLSCAPNVVSGHLAHHSGPSPASAYAYRSMDHEKRENVDKAWADAEHAMDHNKMHHFAMDGDNHAHENLHL